ncbi:MAG: hypothetical protein A2Z03_05805 [Chloroflexi bacterium RBG_16_56_8]|nr:MAG: hypothetical protein A2Z03_05805 [Chloroflexi bacterium RBG_16_56_8]
MLNLEELEAAGEGLTEGWFQLMRFIKAIGLRIIEFLAQIEEFQKMLWEKKKFVTETFYVVTVGHIPTAFYPEIAACETQWEEWRTLGILENKSIKMKADERLPFLKAHPSLPLDTRHFSPDFLDRLLISFDNLDDMTDGLLVHAENWQALNLLKEKYREGVQCIYIDPPYNSPATEIPYKNNYKDSSWLSLMSERLLISFGLLDSEARYSIAIDDYEQHYLSGLLDRILPNYERYMVIVNHHPQGGMSHNVSRTHEYMIMMAQRDVDVLRGKAKTGDVEYRSFMLSGPGSNKSRSGRPNSFYALLIDPETKRIVGAEPPPPFGEKYPIDNTKQGYLRRYPLSPSGEEKVWCRSYVSGIELVKQGKIRVTDGGTIKIAFDTEGRRYSLMSNWTDSKYNAGPHGTALVAEIIGNRELFAYPKSIYTVADAVVAMTWQIEEPTILDYFAGSGTTGHAVINLNREDGGQRKFILVEMAHYFDTVLLPRIKKVTFSPEWKDGKPKRMATQEEGERGPRIVKVIRLESYEDALNNIAFDDSGGQIALQLEDYLLQYMLRWETRKSETLLNVEKLQNPFTYQLYIHREGETRAQPVDLPETFNYLIGLNEQMRQALDDKGRRYLVYRGATRQGRNTVVIWRETEGWTEEDYQRDRDLVVAQKLTEGADDIFVNGDSLIPGALALEVVFKARMFTGVEG